MKRKISLFVLIILVLPCMFIFSACSENTKYNINFIVDEEIYATIETNGNEYISFPQDPNQDNYIFVGWFYDRNTWTNELTASTYCNTILTKNINVYAYFEHIDNIVYAESITLNKSSIFLNITEEFSLDATILPANTTFKKVNWSSSNISVATVDNGEVVAVGKGQATITAKTNNNLTAICEINVVDSSENIQVEVYIDNQKVDTITTNYVKQYQIIAPEKPEDITTNPNSEKYFYGWFVDSNYQTPLTEDRQFLNNGKIYGKWIDIYSNNFTYSVNKGIASITSFTNANDATEIVVPCYINSFPVETIAANVFKNQTLLRNVIICNGIKNIGASSFYNCNSMESIDLPNSIETIATSAFENCEILRKITIPNSVKTIESYAFKNCDGLTSINLTNNITQVGFDIFSDCDSLITLNYEGSLSDWINNSTGKSGILGIVDNFYINNIAVGSKIEIPADITVIKEYSFYNNKNLVEISLNNTTSIKNSAFYGCYNINKVNINDLSKFFDITFENHTANPLYYTKYLYLNDEILTDIVVPENVSNINKYAFAGYESLTSITISSNVTSIGASAFYSCSGLTEMTLPFVGSSATATSASSSTLFGYIFGTIPESLKLVTITGGEILYKAFSDCLGLTSIKLPNNLTSIGNYVFSGCSGLTSIEIPNSVTHIGDYAFSNCSKLTDIDIPSSVINIGSSAFSGCSGLSEMTLPFIGGSTTATSASSSTLFGYIFGISSYAGGVSTQQYYSSSSITYYIPTSLKSVTITGGDILYGAFSSCSGLTSITLPNNLINIGNYAFSKCNGLTSIEIPNSVTHIGNYAFSNCSKLTNIEIPSSVINIGDSAFSGCIGLIEMTLPFIGGSATATDNIGSTFFGYIFGATTYIGGLYTQQYFSNSKYSLYYFYCIPTSLKSITITGGKIADGAFYNCSGLTSITILSNVTSIGECAFYNCSGLVSVKLANDITSIDDYAFYGCNNLTVITIPSSVTSIGSGAFSNCSGLTSIILSRNLSSVGWFVFKNCNSVIIYCESEFCSSSWSGEWNRPVYLYSETKPTESGNYWHYVEGEICVWED